MIKKLLKAIHNFFLLFGVNISFVKREEGQLSSLNHNTAEEMDRFFSDPESVKSYINSSREDFYKRVLSLIESKNLTLASKKIADVGCGTGHLLKALRDKFGKANYYGFDFSEAAIRVAKNVFPDAEYNVHDIYQPLSTKFDFVICTEVLEHLEYPARALNNLLRTLNPDGSLLLTVPNGRTDTYAGHINYWSPESWRVFIEENSGGFEFETGLLRETEIWALIKKPFISID